MDAFSAISLRLAGCGGIVGLGVRVAGDEEIVEEPLRPLPRCWGNRDGLGRIGRLTVCGAGERVSATSGKWRGGNDIRVPCTDCGWPDATGGIAVASTRSAQLLGSGGISVGGRTSLSASYNASAAALPVRWFLEFGNPSPADRSGGARSGPDMRTTSSTLF